MRGTGGLRHATVTVAAGRTLRGWLAMGEVAVPWFVVVDGRPFAPWPLLGLAPTGSWADDER